VSDHPAPPHRLEHVHAPIVLVGNVAAVDLIDVLAREIGPRLAGSDASARAARAVEDALRELGLEPRLQEFPFLAYEPDEPELEVDGERWEAGPVMYAQPADVEGAVRPIGTHVVLPGLFEPPAFAIEDDGRELARLYGNPIGGGATPFPTGYGPTATGPGAYVSAADADRIEDGARVRLRVGGRFVPTRERNVLAELPGESDETVIVCAHYDSAWRATGAVDNASGVEAMRRIADRLAGRRHRRTFLAIGFGAEEFGLAGSRFFVTDARTRGELGRVAAVVNLECLGRGERLELWAGPDELRERGVRIARELGLGELTTRPPIGGSDHFPFASEGIPAACVARWPFPEYHLPVDTPDLVDDALLEQATELAARLVAQLLG
jgi:Iap family predicted aminopeptidase